jgi:hypothetical protein
MRRPGAPRVRNQRDAQGTATAADRNRGLPDPRAKPRFPRGNQLVTARPVAVFVLAPNAPETASRIDQAAKSGRVGGSGAAPRRHDPGRGSRQPLADVIAARPHGSSVTTAPDRRHAEQTPTCVRLRSY